MATQLQRSAATRTRLLEATIESLVDHGTQGSTTAGICKRAGVSKGAMLHHYPTKASLFAGAIEHLLSRRLTEFSARFATQRRPRKSASSGGASSSIRRRRGFTRSRARRSWRRSTACQRTVRAK